METNNNSKDKNSNKTKNENDINEQEFENILSNFEDKYNINKKIVEKENVEKKTDLVINKVFDEFKDELENDTKSNNYKYTNLLHNLCKTNNINSKKFNTINDKLQINKSEAQKSKSKNKNCDNDFDNNDDNEENDNINNTNLNIADINERYMKYLNLILDFYLDFEDCDFSNSQKLINEVYKLNNFVLINDISKLKKGDIIRYPIVKNIDKNTNNKYEIIKYPKLIQVYFVEKRSNYLKVKNYNNNNWNIWSDLPIFKKIKKT